MPSSESLVVNGTNIVDTYVFGPAGAPSTAEALNNDAQIAATAASLANLKNPLLASSTFSAAGGAAAAGTAALVANLKEGKDINALNDAVSVAGDLIIMAGAFAEVSGNSELADLIEGWGDVLAITGITLNHAGPVIVATNELLTEADEEDAFLEGQAASPSLNSTPFGAAMGKISYEMANDSNAIGIAIKNIGTSAFNSAMNSVSTTLNNLEATIVSDFLSLDTTAPNVTDTVTGNTSVITGGMVGNITGIASITSGSGSSTGLDMTGNNGNLNETYAASSNGVLTDTVQSFNQNGTTQYTQVTVTPTSGQVTATITGIGDVAESSDAAVNITPGANAAVEGDFNAITLSANSGVTVDGAVDSVKVTATIGAASVILSGTSEQITFSGSESVTVTDGTQVNVTGTDGVLTAMNDMGTTGYITNTINWNAGGSQVQNFSGLPSGVTQVDYNYSGYNGSGTLLSTTFITDQAGLNPALGSNDNGVLGALVINTADKTQSFVLSDGNRTLALPALTGTAADPLGSPGTDTPLELLTAELSDLRYSGSLGLSSTGQTFSTGNAANQTVSATYFGNDTLKGGTGAGDKFYAGAGVDTITTGSGAGDFVIAQYGLAPGSSLTGGSSTDTLATGGDISGATVTGVHTLQVGGVAQNDVTLNAAEFNGFATIFDFGSGNGLLTVNSIGTYSLNAGNLQGSFTVDFNAPSATTVTLTGPGGNSYDATGTGAITLNASGAAGTTLTASGGGNDTLTAQTGDNTLSSGGKNTLNIGKDAIKAANDNGSQIVIKAA